VARAVALLTACALPGFVTGSVVLEIREDFPLGPGALGISFSTFWGMSALASAPAGRVVERLGPAWGMRLAGGIAAASSAAIAAWAGSALGLTLLLAVGGTAISFWRVSPSAAAPWPSASRSPRCRAACCWPASPSPPWPSRWAGASSSWGPPCWPCWPPRRPPRRGGRGR
jgi:hypothetical protein